LASAIEVPSSPAYHYHAGLPHPFDQKPEPSQESRKTNVVSYAVPAIGFLVLLGGLALGMTRFNPSPSTRSPEVSSAESRTTNPSLLEPAGNWQANNHVHGLAVHPENSQVIFIATHNGLLKRSESGQWLWVQPQPERADYMGFTGDPNNPDRFYASGHPQNGGNLGFVVSQNQGRDWQQLSMPGVDFHALAIAPSNSRIFYGFAVSGAQGLFSSTDGGQTWELLGNDPEEPILYLAVAPDNPQLLYAISERNSVFQSQDGGNPCHRNSL